MNWKRKFRNPVPCPERRKRNGTTPRKAWHLPVVVGAADSSVNRAAQKIMAQVGLVGMDRSMRV